MASLLSLSLPVGQAQGWACHWVRIKLIVEMRVVDVEFSAALVPPSKKKSNQTVSGNLQFLYAHSVATKRKHTFATTAHALTVLPCLYIGDNERATSQPWSRQALTNSRDSSSCLTKLLILATERIMTAMVYPEVSGLWKFSAMRTAGFGRSTPCPEPSEQDVVHLMTLGRLQTSTPM